jgi:hypothetical protein
MWAVCERDPSHRWVARSLPGSDSYTIEGVWVE